MAPITGPPAKLSRTPIRASGVPRAALGAHTDEILEELGIDPAERERRLLRRVTSWLTSRRKATSDGEPDRSPAWRRAQCDRHRCQETRSQRCPIIKGTKTHQNLKAAFAGESQANRRYLYFARQADIEGYPDVGGLFRDTAEAETGHAHGHLDFLKSVGRPGDGQADRQHGQEPRGRRQRARPSSTPRCTREWRRPRATRGFGDVAEWFETLAKAEKSHAGRFQKALDGLETL